MENALEKALKNTVIADKLEYRLTLKSFFKNEFQYGENCYKIPFSHIIYTKKQIFSYICDSCSFVCKKQKKCDGHQFFKFTELIYQFERHSVKDKKVYFKYFLFYSFTLTSDIEMTLKPTKIKGWRMLPIEMQVISNLTYSQRLSFLKQYFLNF